MDTHVAIDMPLEKVRKKEHIDLPIEYFSISIRKFALLGLCTVGFYGYYWFYRNWKIVKEKGNENIWPFWRAVFSVFFCYSLFRRVFTLARSQGYHPLFSPAWLAAGYILLWLAFWYLSSPWWVIGIFTFVPLLKVQEAINYTNKKLHFRAAPSNAFTRVEKIIMTIGTILLLMSLIGLFLPG